MKTRSLARNQGGFARRASLVAVFAMLLSFVGFASATSASADTLVHITGTVTSQSGAGVANVSVTATDPGGSITLFGPSTTAADGSYVLDVSPGTYDIRFVGSNGSGLIPVVQSNFSAVSDQVLNVQFTPTARTLSGYVQDASGHPAEGALVQFYSSSGANASALSDSTGHFSTQVNPGVYRIVQINVPLGASGLPVYYVAPSGTAPTYDLTNADAVVPDLELPAAVNLKVEVRDSSGNPVANHAVYVGNDSSAPTVSATLREGGAAESYSGQYIVSGDYTVRTGTDGTVTVKVPVSTIFGQSRGSSSAADNLCTDGPAGLICVPAPLTVSADTTIVLQPQPSDTNPPTVTSTQSPQANNAGWNNSDVTVTWVATDDSGSATTPSPNTVSSEGVNQSVTSGQSCDSSNNCATGTVSGISIDKTAPSTAVSGATDGTTYPYGQPPTPTCTDSDALSGIATHSTVSVTHTGANYTATCSGAVDVAGNTGASATIHYSVSTQQTITVTVVDSHGNPIPSATVSRAGSNGTFGPKTAVNAAGQVVFNVTSGTNTFTAYVAGGYQTKSVTVTASGPSAVTFATVPTTVSIVDPDAADIAAATVRHAGNTGTFGPKTAVDAAGQVVFETLPGTNTFTAYVAGGYQTKSVTVTASGTNAVNFNTVTVIVTVVDSQGNPRTNATVTHAGNTGTFGPKTAVDAAGQVVFQVLPGTNTFTAWVGATYKTSSLTVSGSTGLTIIV